MRRIYSKQDKKEHEKIIGHPSPEEINETNDTELDRISRSKIFDTFYEFTDKTVAFILRTTIFLFKISGVYILWIGLHYFSAHLYVKFCVPNSVVGFIMSPFMITTPHCQGLRWIVYNAANIINHMWIVIGAWIYSMIWITGTEQTRET
jgi:hypothetical protein